jgi:anthranilate O-methyltransferase
MLETRPILEKAMKEAYTNLHSRTMVIADLGCSSGPNTLHFVSKAIDSITHLCDELNQRYKCLQLQFFLNDLPGNDFNNLFRLFAPFKKLKAEYHMGEALPPYYINGLPGSFYTRLFPCQTVHLFHSSFCLHWRSQVCMFIKISSSYACVSCILRMDST